MTNFNYIFIGAGPAALAAANVLTQNNVQDILVLDAGPEFAARGCPGLAQAACLSCAGDLCQVTNGVGGSAAGFGNKLCHLPASDGLRALIPDSDWPTIGTMVADLVGRYVTGSQSIGDRKIDSQLKHYDTDVLMRREYRMLIQRLIGGLGSTAQLRSGSRVESISKLVDGGFVVKVSGQPLLRARNVVLATGRSGHEFIRNAFDSLGVSYRENAPDMGLRIEVNTASIEHGFFYQDDPKFKFEEPEGVSRTFCTCRDGVIVPVKHGEGVFADGAFINRPSGRTNVALMVRSNAQVAPDRLEAWVRTINRQAQEQLILDEIEEGTGIDEIAARVIRAIPEWPFDAHRVLFERLVRKMIGRDGVLLLQSKRNLGSVRIYGPAIDRFWPSPELQHGFGSSVTGLSVIGDAAGLSRGVVQSIVSGTSFALNELKTASTASMKFRTQQIRRCAVVSSVQ